MHGRILWACHVATLAKALLLPERPYLVGSKFSLTLLQGLTHDEVVAANIGVVPPFSVITRIGRLVGLKS